MFVTHDQEEALELADRVVVMREARIEQIGSPREIYDHPATPFVYEFLGSANRLPCRVRAGFVEVAGGRFAAPPGLGGRRRRRDAVRAAARPRGRARRPRRAACRRC